MSSPAVTGAKTGRKAIQEGKESDQCQLERSILNGCQFECSRFT